MSDPQELVHTKNELQNKSTSPLCFRRLDIPYRLHASNNGSIRQIWLLDPTGFFLSAKRLDVAEVSRVTCRLIASVAALWKKTGFCLDKSTQNDKSKIARVMCRCHVGNRWILILWDWTGIFPQLSFHTLYEGYSLRRFFLGEKQSSHNSLVCTFPPLPFVPSLFISIDSSSL